MKDEEEEEREEDEGSGTFPASSGSLFITLTVR